ncbi:MAG TPA: hypothetical protein VF615_14190 [Longimicrobiaceae bacterium]|jgi:hypothetical protein
MKHLARLTAKGVFSLAIVASLGFGATQAAPALATAVKAPPPCTDWYCNDYCTGRGYSYGVCNTTTLRCDCR